MSVTKAAIDKELLKPENRSKLMQSLIDGVLDWSEDVEKTLYREDSRGLFNSQKYILKEYALFDAIKDNKPEVIEWLVKHGGRLINEPVIGVMRFMDNKWPLSYAMIVVGNASLVELLISLGAKNDPESIAYAEFLATERNDKTMLQLLEKNGYKKSKESQDKTDIKSLAEVNAKNSAEVVVVKPSSEKVEDSVEVIVAKPTDAPVNDFGRNNK